MNEVNHLLLGRTILDSIIRDVVHQRIGDYEKLAETLRQVTETTFFDGRRTNELLQAVEGGIEIATSTADIPVAAAGVSDTNVERRKSGSDEVNVTLETNNADVNDSHPSALPTGLFDRSLLSSKRVHPGHLDENNDEREDDEDNAGEQ